MENIVVAALCITALFAKSKLMTDHAIVPKQLYTGLVLSLSIVAIAVKLLLGKGFKITPYSWSVIITAICSAESLYAIFQFCVTRLLGLDVFICGTFENPVGLMSALCLALPFTLYAIAQTCHKKTFIAAAIVIVLAIFASQSRTGIIAALLVLLCFGLRFSKLSLSKRLFIVAGLTVILIAVSCLINTDSVTGRLLIWRASLPLISATPFCGYGIGAFGRLYMEAQAEYLSAFSPDSDYAMLAGNSIVPFNEYIDFYLNFGILGLLIFIGFVSFLIFAYCRAIESYKSYALYSLGALAFISLFSYPFTYPFTYVIILISTLFIIKNSFKFSPVKLLKPAVASIMLLIGVFCSYKVYDRIDAELQWGKAFIKGDLNAYAILKPRLEHIPHFLYSYAFEAYKREDYDLSLSLAEQCSNDLSHYDLELLLGDIYLKKENYDRAEFHYKHAAEMIPCRFTPLLALYDTFTALGDEHMAKDIAEYILAKPIKVHSRTVGLIRHKMQKALKVTSNK
ncbi:MAG: O-antigen ligase family protein [Muribaculaceae bacterium]|nr:O-antigen ligase family protein [Muribaculaceae bacterium]